SLKLTLDSGRDFSIASLTTASGVPLALAAPDTVINLDDRSLAFGNRAAGFRLQSVTTDSSGDRLQLNAAFELPQAHLRMTRHYAIVNGSPAFEAWTTFTPDSSASALIDLSALQITVPPGPVRWINGLQGSAADVRNDASFSLQQRLLE